MVLIVDWHSVSQLARDGELHVKTEELDPATSFGLLKIRILTNATRKEAL